MFSTRSLLATEMEKPETFMKKPVCFGLSTLVLNKILIYEFWYGYVKPKYVKKEKLCYMDTVIVYIETGDIYKEIAEDIETRFDILNCELKLNSLIGY